MYLNTVYIDTGDCSSTSVNATELANSIYVITGNYSMVFQSCDIRIHWIVAHEKAVATFVILRLIQQLTDLNSVHALTNISSLLRRAILFGKFTSSQCICTRYFPP